MVELRVFPGGYQKGVWRHDRDCSDEEISSLRKTGVNPH